MQGENNDEELKSLAQNDLVLARALAVTDKESYLKCCAMELAQKKAIKEVKEKLKPVIENTRKAWKAALQLEKDVLEPREIALEIIQELRMGYEAAQKNLAAARQQEEQAKELERSRAQNEQVIATLEQAGENELAQQVRESMASTVPTVRVEPDIPEVKGIRNRTVWNYEILDASKVSRAYMIPDDTRIQGLVNSQHKDAEQIVGGIRVWSEEVPLGAAKK